MTKYTDFINYNLSMLTDRTRTEAYRQAIMQTVRSGDVVLDLGCGSGILGFFACQAGARRVYAIESEVIIEMAKEISVKNGYEDRVVFLNDSSFRVELPERVDVLVTETLGTFGLDEGLLGAVIDARTRFLKPSGALIPRSLAVSVVPVELPKFYQHMIDFWATDRYGVDVSPVRRYAANNFHPLKLHEEAYLSSPATVLRLLLAQATSSDVHAEVSFYATSRGKLHGFAGWFTTELTPETMLSNSPANETAHWGSAFFPLQRPVSLDRGNRVRLTMDSRQNGAVWRWQVEVNGEQFEQSTAQGFPQAPGEADKLAPGSAPMLSPKGKAQLLLLGLLDGKKTIREVELELLQRCPELIGTRDQAVALVRDTVMRFA